MKLSKREQLLLLVLAGLIAASGVYYFVYQPLERELQELETRLQHKTQQLTQLRLWRGKEKDIQREIAALNTQLEQYRQRLIEVGTRPLLLLFLNELADHSQVRLQTISPHDSGLSLAFTGDYSSVKAFIRGLEGLENIYQLRSLNISAQSQGLLCNLSADFRQLADERDVAAVYRDYTTSSGTTYGKENPFGIR